jgi:DNA-directed RNA polymerase specialized sigma24 family protein
VLPDLAAPDVELEAVFLRAELRTLPKGVIEALPRAHQQILHLRFIEELDHAAIAVRMNTTEQAARQRLYRALQALRALCAEYDLDVP